MEAFPNAGDLPRNELAAEALRSFGALRLRVTGSSMLPTIRPDDVLHVRRCRVEQTGAGDIVLFIRDRRLFAHRVISRTGDSLVTQGDGVDSADPLVTADELLGRVIKVMRRGEPIEPDFRQTLAARIAAAVFRRSAIAGRVFSLFHRLRCRTCP